MKLISKIREHPCQFVAAPIFIQAMNQISSNSFGTAPTQRPHLHHRAAENAEKGFLCYNSAISASRGSSVCFAVKNLSVALLRDYSDFERLQQIRNINPITK